MKNMIVLTILALCATVIFAEPTTYSKILPETTSMVIVCNSPANFLAKFNMEKHGSLLENIREETSKEGFDITDPAKYAENGIDLSKPSGVAFLNESMDQFVLFFAVSDKAKFDLLFTKLSQQETTWQETIADVPCTLQGMQEAPEMIMFSKDGYVFMFGTVGYSAVTQIRQVVANVIQCEKHLFEYKPYAECVENLSGNLFYYMDYGKLVAKNLATESANLPEKERAQMDNLSKIAEEITSLGVDLEWNVDKLVMNFYLGIKADSKILKSYVSTQNCSDLLKAMRPNPLICVNSNGDMQIGWETNKASLDLALESMGIGFKNLDELFGLIEMTAKGSLEIDLDIERDIIKNIQGSSLLAMYDLPTNEMSADLIIAVKLNDEKVVADLFNKLVTAVKAQNAEFPITIAPLGTNHVYTFDIAQINPMLSSLSPSLGIVGSYLIIATKKEMLNEILEGQGNLLANVQDTKIADGLANGAPSVGFIKIASLAQQIATLMPDPQLEVANMFLQHFIELRWTSQVKDNSFFATITLQGDGDLLEKFLIESDKIREMQRKAQEQRMKEYEEFMKRYEEQRMLEEKQRMLEEKQRMFDEKQRILDEKQRSLNEEQRMLDEEKNQADKPTSEGTEPTPAPTTEPTTAPTTEPTTAPTTEPTTAPTTEPTTAPTTEPAAEPTPAPTDEEIDDETDETDEGTEEETDDETEPTPEATPAE